MGTLCGGGPAAEAASSGYPPISNLNKQSKIKIADFLSVCIYLSEECGKIIREVEESGEHQRKDKGVNNPVTIADIRVQKTLEVCLKDLYPTLRIEGEESKESMEGIEPCVDPNLITDKIREFIKIKALN